MKLLVIEEEKFEHHLKVHHGSIHQSSMAITSVLERMKEDSRIIEPDKSIKERAKLHAETENEIPGNELRELTESQISGLKMVRYLSENDYTKGATEQQIIEQAAKECEHPYAFVWRKLDFEKCIKCGKVLCEG